MTRDPWDILYPTTANSADPLSPWSGQTSSGVEIDLRVEMQRTLYGAVDEIAKGRTGLLRRMRVDSNGERIKCPCRDTITDEPDQDFYCRTCVLPSAMIPTEQGIQQAKEIIPGIKVLAGDGRFREVTNIYAKLYSGTMVSLYTCGRTNMPLTVTADHEIFVLKNPQFCHRKKALGQICRPELCSAANCKTKTRNPEGFETEIIEKRADEIIEGDYVCIPRTRLSTEYISELTVNWKKYQASNGIQAFEPPAKIKIDEDLMFFLGWYVAEGSGGSVGRKTRSAIFSLHREKEKAIANELLRIAKDKFGLEGKIATPAEKTKKSLQVKFDNAVLSRWLHESCGRYSDHKQIPQFIWSLPKFLQHAFIVNFMLGDGHRNVQNWEVTGITSQVLAEEIYIMAIGLGFCPTISFKEAYSNSDGQAHADSWYVTWLSSQQKDSTKQITKWRRRFKTDNYIFSRIERVTYKEEETAVYDFTIDKEHSFVADGILVHNCLGMGYLWDERELVYYKNDDTLRKSDEAFFYVEYFVEPSVGDYVVEVVRNTEGVITPPGERQGLFKIIKAEAFRSDTGRIEYWRCRTKYERKWSVWYGVPSRQHEPTAGS